MPASPAIQHLGRPKSASTYTYTVLNMKPEFLGYGSIYKIPWNLYQPQIDQQTADVSKSIRPSR